ncbi:MAG: hypothetical protein AAF846_28525 [Chloroflexota bacterium]
MNYLERYLTGEYKAVWDELIELGQSELSPKIYHEAEAVAHELMYRVRFNIDNLHKKLIKLNYKFAESEYIYIEPPADTATVYIPHLEKVFGRMPLSFRLFYELIGIVCFVGDHPLLATYNNQKRNDIYSDPLFWMPTEFIYDQVLTYAVSDGQSYDYAIAFCPDYYHKAGVSGGDSISIRLQGNLIDGQVIGLPQPVYFVDYLRNIFFWGGFMGFENYVNGLWSDNKWKFPLIELSYLTEGLKPF